MGGRGASSSLARNSSPAKSSLEIFKDNARQFNDALKKAQVAKASIVEFTDVTNTVFRRYWNGSTFVDRKAALYERERKGIYKAKYKGQKLQH